jgi:uncharacterized membrane protein
MAMLLALVYDDVETAEKSLDTAKAMESYGYLTIMDQALIKKNEKGKVEVDEKKHPVGRGAIAGGILGGIVGTVFLIPVAGVAAGAALGAIFGHGQKGGADDFKSFTEKVKADLPNGGAAVILLGHTEGPDRVINDLGGLGGRVYTLDLHEDQLAALQKEVDRAAAKHNAGAQ